MCYGVSCLDAGLIAISFARHLSGRDSQLKNIRRHFRQRDDPIGECFSGRFLRTEPVMKSIPKYAIRFSVAGVRECVWQRQSERLIAASYRLNLGCPGYAVIARVEEVE